jgi:hypothetical protein
MCWSSRIANYTKQMVLSRWEPLFIPGIKMKIGWKWNNSYESVVLHAESFFRGQKGLLDETSSLFLLFSSDVNLSSQIEIPLS